MALGFHEYLLRESKQDVIKICEKIAAGEEVNLHWDMLASYMEQIGNQLKADFIRSVIDAVSSRPESPSGQREVNNLLASGLKGFCCPDGPVAYLDYASGRSKPSLIASVMLEGNKVNCRIPLRKDAVEAAIATQMGVCQHLGRNVSANQLDIDSVALASVRDAKAIQGVFTPAMRSAEDQMRTITDMVRADVASGRPKLISRLGGYYYVESDIESYSAIRSVLDFMIVRANL